MEDIELYPIRTSLASAKDSSKTPSEFGLKDSLIKKNHESPPSDNRATFEIPFSFFKKLAGASLKNNSLLPVSKDRSPSVSSTTEPHTDARPKPRTVITLRNPNSGDSTVPAPDTVAAENPPNSGRIVQTGNVTAENDPNSGSTDETFVTAEGPPNRDRIFLNRVKRWFWKSVPSVVGIKDNGNHQRTERLRMHFWFTFTFVILFLLFFMISILFAKGVFGTLGPQKPEEEKEVLSKEQDKRTFQIFRVFFRISMFFVFLVVCQIFQVYLDYEHDRVIWKNARNRWAFGMCLVFMIVLILYIVFSVRLKVEPYGVHDYTTTALGSILALGSTFGLLFGYSATHARG